MSTPYDHLATISFANFEERKHEIADQLFRSASTIGFFYIVDHGIPQEDIDRAFALGTQFFNLPEEDKKKSQFDVDTYLGWRGIPELSEVTGTSLWEWLSLGYDHPENQSAQERFPDEDKVPGFREFSQKFMRNSHEVALKTLRGLAIGLGLPEDFYLEAQDNSAPDNGSFLAFNHYPPTEKYWKPGDTMRLHAHADVTMVTLVFQRLGEIGLEVSPGRETVADPRVSDQDLTGAWAGIPSNLNNWVPAYPKEGAITVNIGDILMRWSDDKLKSTYHRVRVPEKEKGEPQGERRTVAYFTTPRKSAVIQGPKKKYPAKTSGDIVKAEGNAYEKKKGDPVWQQVAYKKETAAANGTAPASAPTVKAAA